MRFFKQIVTTLPEATAFGYAEVKDKNTGKLVRYVLHMSADYPRKQDGARLSNLIEITIHEARALFTEQRTQLLIDFMLDTTLDYNTDEL